MTKNGEGNNTGNPVVLSLAQRIAQLKNHGMNVGDEEEPPKKNVVVEEAPVEEHASVETDNSDIRSGLDETAVESGSHVGSETVGTNVDPEVTEVVATESPPEDEPEREVEEETCTICYCGYPPEEMLNFPCCDKRCCETCAPHCVVAEDSTCSFCKEFQDPNLFFKTIVTDVEQVRLLDRAWAIHEGNWLACPQHECNGGHIGRGRKNTQLKCDQCGTEYCSYCEYSNGEKVKHPGQSCEEYEQSQTSQESTSWFAEEVDEDDERAWLGAVSCPHCGTPAGTRVEGCDTLTCQNPKCKKQFAADGGEVSHGSGAGAFDLAIKSFTERTKKEEVERLLDEHAKMVRAFKLDKFIGLLERAESREQGLQLLSKLALLNGDGFKACLARHYLPREEAEIQYETELSEATTLQGIREVLQRAGFDEDATLVAEIIEKKGTSPGFVLQGIANKMKDRLAKGKVGKLI